MEIAGWKRLRVRTARQGAGDRAQSSNMQHAQGGPQSAQAVATGYDEGGGSTQLHARILACTASHHGMAAHPAHTQGSATHARQSGAVRLRQVMVPGRCA